MDMVVRVIELEVRVSRLLDALREVEVVLSEAGWYGGEAERGRLLEELSGIVGDALEEEAAEEEEEKTFGEKIRERLEAEGGEGGEGW